MNKPPIRIAILDDYLNLARTSAPWSELEPSCEVTVFGRHLGDPDAVVQALRDFDVLVVMRERTALPALVLDQLPALKLIVTTGMRNAAIDMARARERGIDVCGVNITGYAAFEHTWALILALVKRIPAADRCLREGGWQEGAGTGLSGKTLGLMGLGRLGAWTGKVGQAFDMKVIAWSQNLTEQRAAEQGATLVSKDELMARSDVLSIHLVLSDRTRHLVGAQELAAMKPTAYLVNTSRGPIVDEAALVDVLRRRRIAGAALDVFDVEPLPAGHPFRTLDNTVLTGHTGYAIQEALEMGYQGAVRAIAGWLDGKPVDVIN